MNSHDCQPNTALTPDWMGVGEARDLILADVPAPRVERRQLLDCLGYVLGEAITSPIDLPPWNNSAMDGFAVRAEDIMGTTAAKPRTLRVMDDVPAGTFPTRPVSTGEATRIMTGAPVPDGADSVVRVEHTDGGHSIGTPNGSVAIFNDADANRNIRARGEDLKLGDAVLDAGTLLGPAEIGIAASVGQADLQVCSLPSVAILTSGDELVDLDGFDEVLAGRKIVSSNSYTLASQLAEIGIQPRILGIARDKPTSVRVHLEKAHGCDVVISSAGVSVGEHDYLKAVLHDLQTDFKLWRVRMRPGSAFGYGRVGDLGGIPWFGLPGNPVSSMVTFEIFVRPALLRMAGHRAVFRPTARVRLAEGLNFKAGLAQFPRASLYSDRDGEIRAKMAPAQGSGILTSMSGADALIHIPEEISGLTAGEAATAILLRGAPLVEEPGF